MQATITFSLTEAAQRAQMVATGQPVARQQTTTEDVPSEYLTSPYCVIAADGTVSYNLIRTVNISEQGVIDGWTHSSIYGPLEAQPESGLAALRAKTAAVYAKSAELKEADARNQITRAADAKRREEEDEKRRVEYRERKAMEDAADNAREDAKVTFLNAWVASADDSTLRQQWSAGLLCRSELLAIIAEKTFADLGLVEHDFTACKNRDCPCGLKDIQCIPRADYPEWLKIKERLPEGTKVACERVRECLRDADGGIDDGEEAGAPYTTALLKVAVGPFTFERRIKV